MQFCYFVVVENKKYVMPVLKTLHNGLTGSLEKCKFLPRGTGWAPSLRSDLAPTLLTPVNLPAMGPPPKPVTPGASGLPWVA